ncbi:hypothetical protein ABIA33_007637 [Streptacidiphilus sp. MAP12-16]|uniref:hypothetical protein n=1 Tax=Streptacidiphilus sp. MAP12-16 TaxID=3156300 RepID=UPI00351452E4
MSKILSTHPLRNGLLILLAAWSGYAWAVARLGSVGGVLVLVLYVAAPLSWLVYRTYALRARIRRGWAELSHALGLWEQAPLPRFDAEYEYKWLYLPSGIAPAIRRVVAPRGTGCGFQVAADHGSGGLAARFPTTTRPPIGKCEKVAV